MDFISLIPFIGWLWLVFLAIDTSILMIIYLPYALQVSKKDQKTHQTEILPPISIIVAARNESHNLLNLIPKLFEQQYHRFEVIVVDDCSYDDSHDVLIAFDGKYTNFKYSRVQESNKFHGGKKFALTMGIKAAQFEHCVFIDADCEPARHNWLTGYGKAFANGNEIVLGHGAYKKDKGFLNALIRYETDQIAAQYFSFTHLGLRFMGVGRNMGYTKTLFFKNKGFSKHLQLKSGDDDLFISQLPKNVKFGLLCDAQFNTQSIAKKSFAEWFMQKRRHVSTSKFYKPIIKIILGFLMLMKLSLLLLALVNLIGFFHYWWLTLPALMWFFMIRWALQWPIIKRIGYKQVIFMNFIIEPLLWLSYLALPIFNFFKKEIHWKH